MSDTTDDLLKCMDPMIALKVLVDTVHYTIHEFYINRNPSNKRTYADEVMARRYQDLIKTYNKGDFDTHANYFFEKYEEFKDRILSTLEDDSWIEDDIVIHFGHDINDVSKEKIIINISKACTTSTTLSNKEDDRLRVLKLKTEISSSGKENELEENKYEYIRDEILYYLIIVFRNTLLSITPDAESEIETLESIAMSVGVDIKVYAKEETKSNSSSGIMGSIARLFENNNIMGPDGKPISETINGIDNGAVDNMIGGFFSNSKLTDKLGQTMKDANEAASSGDGNITNVLGRIFSDIGPTLAETITESSYNMEAPPGVNDNRTAEQIAAEKKEMSDSLSNVMSSAGRIADKLGTELSSEKKNEVPEA